MAKHAIIKLSKSKMIFSNKYTRVMAHDLLNISVNKQKYLTSKEQMMLQNVARKNIDFVVIRNDKQIKITPFV